MRGQTITIFLRFLAFVAAFAACSPAFAEQPAGTRLSLCAAPVRAGQDFAGLIAGKIPLDCNSVQTRHGEGDFWLASQPLRIDVSHPGRLNLRMASVWQNGMTIGLVHADNHVQWIRTTSRTLSRHIVLGAVVEFEVPAYPSPLTRVVWQVTGSVNRSGIVNGAKIATQGESEIANLRMMAMYAGFAGLGIALVVYNLALYGALRHNFQLAYCVMLGSLLVYAFSASGVLAWVFPDFDNNDRQRINYFAIAATAGAAFWFARTFFERRVFDGGLGRLVDGVALAVVMCGILLALIPARWMVEIHLAFSLILVAFVAVIPLIIWRSFVERSDYRWMFTLAWFAPVVMATARVATAINLVGWNFWIDHSTLVAMAVEALLSSLAIAYRIRLLSAERDNAIAQGAVDRALAETDPLTGLMNRRAFLHHAIGRAGNQQLLLLDIDHFKRVNDTLGHDGGDEVLRIVARMLRQCIDESMLVARLGGEEFAIIADMDAAIDPGRVLATLRTTRMPFDLAVTASIGWCSGPLNTEAAWKHLYRCADQALFAAKESGRDRVRGAGTLAIAA